MLEIEPFTRRKLILLGPYRLLFPLGILCGLMGVGHWVLWSIGWVGESSSFFHATMQAQGFLGCFVVGFLMTALPKFLGTGPARSAEVGAATALAAAFAGLTLYHQWAAAQISFILMIVATVIFALRRFPGRSKNPPGSFLLIAFGMLHGIIGPLLMLASGFGTRSIQMMDIGRQMVQIGFLLCLVLGVAGYLAPFLTGYAGDPSCDPGVNPLRSAERLAMTFHALTGFVIFASFFCEPRWPRSAQAARGLAALLHFLLFARIWRPVRRKLTHIYFFWLACWLIPLGLLAAALWPELRISMLHILFIGGYTLMIFSFAVIVVFSHGADAARLNGKLIPLRLVNGAILAALVLRITADFDAWHYRWWIHAASSLWWLATLAWLIYIFPKLWRAPLPESSNR